MRRAKAMSWYRFSRTQVLPTGCGCGQQRITCASPLPPRWNARKTWPLLVPKERSNDRCGPCGQCGAGALAHEERGEPQAVFKARIFSAYRDGAAIDVDFAFQCSLRLSH